MIIITSSSSNLFVKNLFGMRHSDSQSYNNIVYKRVYLHENYDIPIRTTRTILMQTDASATLDSKRILRV